MDNRLNILRHLYRDEDSGQLSSLIEEDDALRREYQALSEIKYHLDQRPRQRPDPLVLDAIFAAVAETDRGRVVRKDRPAKRPSGRPRTRTARLVSAMLALVVAMGIGLGYFLRVEAPVSSNLVSSTTVAEPEAAAPLAVVPEQQTPVEDMAAPPSVSQEVAVTQSFAPDAGTPVPARMRDAAVERAPALAEQRSPASTAREQRKPTPVALEWDASDEVRRLHQRIGLIESRSTGTSWDAIPVRVDVLRQLDGGAAGVRPATQMSTDWDF